MDYEQFKVPVYQLTNIDLNCYKERQMKRRIDTLIDKHKFSGYEDYVHALKHDKELFEEFVEHITINVSEFYRNPEQWNILEKQILPELIANGHGKINVWSAACSTGDEPYSLAMLLSDYLPKRDIHILATDIDKQILEKAAAGIYNQKSMVSLPKKYLEKYFTKIGEKNYKISDEIKRCVEFKNHNLLKDTYPKGFDLILCRNVVIYFTDEAKNMIYKNFYQSLKKHGVLFIGSTEQITNYRELGFDRLSSFYFEKGE